MRLSDDLRSRLIARVRDGAAPREIMPDLNVSRSLVQKFRREFAPCHKGRPGRPRLGKEIERTIAAMATAGETDVRIAAALGVSITTVAERRKALAPDAVRFKGRAPLARVVDLLRAGRSPHEVADNLGVPCRAVQYIRGVYAPELSFRRGRPSRASRP